MCCSNKTMGCNTEQKQVRTARPQVTLLARPGSTAVASRAARCGSVCLLQLRTILMSFHNAQTISALVTSCKPSHSVSCQPGWHARKTAHRTTKCRLYLAPSVLLKMLARKDGWDGAFPIPWASSDTYRQSLTALRRTHPGICHEERFHSL